MPIVLLILLIAVACFLWWRWKFTTLTRECRWREAREEGLWRCAFCGAVSDADGPPRHCLKDQQ